MIKPHRHEAKQNPAYSMWFSGFYEAYLIKARFTEALWSHPQPQFFGNTVIFKLHLRYFFSVSGVLSCLVFSEI